MQVVEIKGRELFFYDVRKEQWMQVGEVDEGEVIRLHIHHGVYVYSKDKWKRRKKSLLEMEYNLYMSHLYTDWSESEWKRKQ